MVLDSHKARLAKWVSLNLVIGAARQKLYLASLNVSKTKQLIINFRNGWKIKRQSASTFLKWK